MELLTNDVCLNCMQPRGGAADCPYCGAVDGEGAWTPPGLRPGVILAGKYLLGRTLGRGGFAVTYLAMHLDLGIRVAIKEFFPSELAERDPQTNRIVPRRSPHANGQEHVYFRRALARFIEEGRNIVRCHEPTRHPNLVHVVDYFEANGAAYLVMDYVDGVSLETHLKRQPSGQISDAEAVRILMPVLDGLRAVHKGGFLHRDIKPANIYLSHQGPIILLDFGAARASLQQEASRTRTILVTPGYAPPEQYSNTGEQGPWSDIYGCAATLYRCVTGVDPINVMDRMAGVPLPRPSEAARRTVSPAMEQAILLGLDSDRNKRPQTAQAYQEMLQRALKGCSSPYEAGGHDKPGNKEPTAERRFVRWTVTALAVVLLFPALVAGVAWFQRASWTESVASNVVERPRRGPSDSPGNAAAVRDTTSISVQTGRRPDTPAPSETLPANASIARPPEPPRQDVSSSTSPERVENTVPAKVKTSEQDENTRLELSRTESPIVVSASSIVSSRQDMETPAPGGITVTQNTHGLTIRYPNRVRTHERVKIEIEATSPFDFQRIGTIALSIEGGEPYITDTGAGYDIFPAGGDKKITRFRQDGSLWRRLDSVIPTRTHVEIYDAAWPAEQRKTLSIPLSFGQKGNATLFVRSTFSARTANGIVVDQNNPSGGNFRDEQGLPCHQFVINIVE